jgi:hypothetical protein
VDNRYRYSRRYRRPWSICSRQAQWRWHHGLSLLPLVAGCSLDHRVFDTVDGMPGAFSTCTPPLGQSSGSAACDAIDEMGGAGVVQTQDGAMIPLAGVDGCGPGTSGCGECSPGDERACVGASGNCAAGRQRCEEDSNWGACSIQPQDADSCEPGDDADCDGVPNNPPGGCQCQSDVRCGITDVGECEYGISTCTAGQLAACVGVVAPAPRDCRSSADNDCDGRPDSSLDGVCQCTPGATERCGPISEFDDVGICRAGQRTCIASTNALSSAWGPCLGAISPGLRSCASAFDNDCNGINDSFDASCACAGGSTRACGTPACPGQQRCELGADGSSAQFGPCVPGPVTFPDRALDAAVRAALPVSVPTNQAIDGALVAALDSIEALDAGISRLDGLECATSLEALEVSVNSISDLRPIAGLPLTFLGIVDNQVADVSVLSSLTQLRLLFMGVNPITDVRPLANLPPLLELQLRDLPISDLTLIANQTELIRLDISSTEVRDLSPVARFPNLVYLELFDTPVADLTPVRSLSQLSLLNVQGTDVDCASPAMRDLASRVEYFYSSCPDL